MSAPSLFESPPTVNWNGRVSVGRAAQLTGGYPLLIRYLAESNGISVERGGGRRQVRFVPQDELGRLRELVRAHLDRPRVTRRKVR